jgi:hypothetical protein
LQQGRLFSLRRGAYPFVDGEVTVHDRTARGLATAGHGEAQSRARGRQMGEVERRGGGVGDTGRQIGRTPAHNVAGFAVDIRALACE